MFFLTGVYIYIFLFLLITAFLECAQKGAVSLSSALDNFREAGEEGKEMLSLAQLVPRTEAVSGPPGGGFRVFKRHIFSLFFFLSFLLSKRGARSFPLFKQSI